MSCIEVEINVLCQKCDNALEAYLCINSNGEQELAVEPCSECLAEATEAGYEDGRADGKIDGHEEGYDEGVEEGRRQANDE